ncbi:hypothetical protein LPJ66_004505 [Kickxella alabastrina]|uniref:Uncharacterized protein n=1 Tax=Kickxella alabastrina TaxID=61397 RepID=A0ACC1IHT7_9FUNG|nr:hypothetical protein LPJ66_004505 [Kickxella alabastrina]
MSTYGNSRPALGENSSYYAAEYQPEQRAGQSSQYLPPYEHYNQVATEGRQDEYRSEKVNNSQGYNTNHNGQPAYQHHSQQDGERNFKDHFYKKPDPNYSGLYGTDYTPEVSKIRVAAVATAAVAAAAWLYRDYKKSRDNKRNDRYQHNMPGHKSQHRRNNSNSAPGIRSYEDTYGHHGKY